MARRNNVLENVRGGQRNARNPRGNYRFRNRNNNSLNNNTNTNRRNVRRVFKARSFKGRPLRRFGAGPVQFEGQGEVNAPRRGRFRRTRRNFAFRRFNKNMRTKQNFKKNKDQKTADQMDMELDTYMGGEATRAKLDADLTNYFSQPEANN
uniref:C-terminal duplication domain of Friend of PRMT1, putative n=1 Tax=Theileria annulata TaxID=5874 RepID=A0A3B0MX23_THEAN